MKALNNKEITNKYLVFLAYFTFLLFFSLLCISLFHKTAESYASVLVEKKNENDFIFNKRMSLSSKIDSLNLFVKLLNTKQVENEGALTRSILKLKNEANDELRVLEVKGKNDYQLYRKIIAGIEAALDNKKVLQQAKNEEDVQRRKLMECIEANNKAKKALSAN